jgi:hypothetical protein
MNFGQAGSPSFLKKRSKKLLMMKAASCNELPRYAR